MFRIIVSTATAFALASSHAAVLSSKRAEPKLTLTVQATSSAKALQLLGTAAHVNLLTTPETAKDILTFRFVDVTLSEAKKRIAEAVDGTWIHEREGERLIRTADQQRQEKAREFEQDVEQMRKAIENFTAHYKQLPPFDSQEANRFAARIQAVLGTVTNTTRPRTLVDQLDAIGADGPINRLVGDAVMHMDPEDLAAIPTHGKTVWSTGPTPMQKAVPDSIMPAIRQFLKDQTLWSATVASHHIQAPEINGMPVAAGDLQGFNNTSNPIVGAILLTAEKGASPNGVWIMVDAYDNDGARIGHGQCNLASDAPDDLDSLKSSSPMPGEQTITFGDEAKALWENQSSDGKSALPPELASKIAHPEQVDPLSLELSPSLVRAAEIKKANMVGCLPDEAFRVIDSGASDPISVEAYLKKLSYFATAVDIRDGWMVARPARPFTNRATLADRRELGEYVRTLLSGKMLSLDEQARFALSLPDPEENFMPDTLVDLLPSSIDKTKLPDRDLLRFYGSLTSDQKAAMTKDGLPMSGLSPDQTECLTRMVYGALRAVIHNSGSGEPFADRLSSRENAIYSMGLMHESTECLPNGIPAQGVILMKTDNAPVVVASRRPGVQAVPTREMTAPQLAFQKWSQDHPEAFGVPLDPAFNFDMSHLKYGKPQRLTFTFQYTPDLLQRAVLEDKSVGDMKTMSIDDLPEDFKKKFDEAYQNQEQRYASRPHPPIRKNPPPPFGS